MFPTYELIASQTLGSDTTLVTLSSIPQNYDDICVEISARDYGTGTVYSHVNLRPNGSTTNYSLRKLLSQGSSASSNTESGWGTFQVGYISGSAATADTFGSTQIYIPNYAGSTFKSVSATSVGESNVATGIYMDVTAGLWSSTSAITSLGFSGFFKTGSSFWLFGIREETA